MQSLRNASRGSIAGVTAFAFRETFLVHWLVIKNHSFSMSDTRYSLSSSFIDPVFRYLACSHYSTILNLARRIESLFESFVTKSGKIPTLLNIISKSINFQLLTWHNINSAILVNLFTKHCCARFFQGWYAFALCLNSAVSYGSWANIFSFLRLSRGRVRVLEIFVYSWHARISVSPGAHTWVFRLMWREHFEISIYILVMSTIWSVQYARTRDWSVERLMMICDK